MSHPVETMLRTWTCKSLTLELWALQTAIKPLVGGNTCRCRKSLPPCPHILSSLSPETMLSRVANWGLWYNMTSVTKTCEQSRNSNPAMVRQDSGLRETQWHSQTCNFLQLVPYEIRSPRAGLIVGIFLNGHLGKRQARFMRDLGIGQGKSLTLPASTEVRRESLAGPTPGQP